MRSPALPRTSLGTVILIFVCVLTKESVEITPVPYRLQVPRVALDGRDPSNPLRREKKQMHCQLGQYLHPRKTHCCMRCHAGTYKAKDCDGPDQATVCLPCSNGTFTAVDNTMSKCFQCKRCRTALQQIVETPCTPKQDTVCGCQKNQYRIDSDSEYFQCRNCSSCADGTITSCSKSKDAICRCKPQFFLSRSNICKPCNSCTGEDCLLCPSPVTTSPTSSGPNPAVLYTVVDHVPPSRWKEFVRRLGLSDYDLERIELEHRRLRDAQYEMLRLWKLQTGHAATLEHISRVLNQMELSGCSDAVQEALLNQTSPQPCSLHNHL
ncbi:Tumor necrosis factor receptor superfamily member 1A [Lonchura striata]|uniref:Tumor necrosis factor receptor superfamily member 1A n=1 Tax=Lonchura striata TaxID=40157 RepID=A0A218VD48_9PASE|nr:Tumor necrosis factor receptor superfamily member 1A [Lonchura striata domestica]